jgi:hypothetical protein
MFTAFKVRHDGMLQAGPTPRFGEVEIVSAVVVELQQLLATRTR